MAVGLLAARIEVVDGRFGALLDTMSRTRVVVAGAGVAGLETALALQAFARDVVSVELVAPESEFTYRPLAVAEPFRRGEARRFPLQRLARAAGAQLRVGTLTAVDPEQKLCTLDEQDVLGYDVLVLTLGARPLEAIAGALTFRGPEDGRQLAELLDRATSGRLRRIVFAIPAAATWPLPLYELALLTAEYLTDHMTRGVEVLLATPEDRPLALFGPDASDAIQGLLQARGIRLEASVVPIGWDKDKGALQLAGGKQLEADAVVALPRLEGRTIVGLPRDGAGFVPTDEFGRVLGLSDVYVAGDLTQFPVKQGGLAAQQADAVASAIAADAGAIAEPTAFRPVLRGLLLTGGAPRFLRSEPATGRAQIDTEPLWWPATKIVGRYLTPFLAEHLGLSNDYPNPQRTDAVPVEVELDTREHAWSTI